MSMTPQEMIDVIAAHRDGARIECREVAGFCRSGWWVCDAPSWDFHHFNYRVQPPVKPTLTAAQLDILNAFEAGNPVEWRPIDSQLAWKPVDARSQIFDFMYREYRVLRPHWPAVLLVRHINPHVLGDALFATVEDARKFYASAMTVIRLATEYPPVMLP